MKWNRLEWIEAGEQNQKGRTKTVCCRAEQIAIQRIKTEQSEMD